MIWHVEKSYIQIKVSKIEWISTSQKGDCFLGFQENFLLEKQKQEQFHLNSFSKNNFERSFFLISKTFLLK